MNDLILGRIVFKHGKYIVEYTTESYESRTFHFENGDILNSGPHVFTRPTYLCFFPDDDVFIGSDLLNSIVSFKILYYNELDAIYPFQAAKIISITH